MIQDAREVSDEAVVEQVRAGEAGRFEVLMRRHNARLFRVARALTGDDDEAEDVMQEAYVRAWTNLARFEGRSSFATWLTRIAVHEALSRRRRRARRLGVEGESDVQDHGPGPEERAAGRELGRLLEAAVDELPPAHRLVFVLREVQGLSGAETAAALDTTEGNVKVRLHRARAALRRALEARAHGALSGVYEFHAPRCDRVVARVLDRISRQ